MNSNTVHYDALFSGEARRQNLYESRLYDGTGAAGHLLYQPK